MYSCKQESMHTGNFCFEIKVSQKSVVRHGFQAGQLPVLRMRFLLRFVAFVKIPLRVSAGKRLQLSSRYCMPMPSSSMAAVHVAAFVRVLHWCLQDFSSLIMKSVMRIDCGKIRLLFFLNILCMVSEPLWHSSP